MAKSKIEKKEEIKGQNIEAVSPVLPEIKETIKEIKEEGKKVIARFRDGDLSYKSTIVIDEITHVIDCVDGIIDVCDESLARILRIMKKPEVQ